MAWAVAVLPLVALVRSAAAEAVEDVCPRVQFIGADRPSLRESERRLVCGDPSREGWTQVPLSQAEYFLRAFLQQHGFHHPKFFPEKDRLKVWVGPRTRIARVDADGLPPGMRLSKRRGVVGAWLTPTALNELQAWVAKELQYRGYGCPTVSVDADADRGLVRVHVDPGPIHIVREVQEAVTGELDSAVFGRFEAFEYGRPLDLRLLNLSAERVVAEDLFLSAYFDLACSSRALAITQRVVTAPPRLITIGGGFDSEDLVRARVRWRNSRIGWRASRFEATLFASQKQQVAHGELRYYTRPGARWYLQPQAEGRHENELRYEALFSNVLFQPGIDLDNQVLRTSVRAGPSFDYVRTLRGEGPPDEAFLSFRTRLQLLSHLYEYYLREPRRGWWTTLETMSRQRGVYSDFTAHRVDLTGQALWNVGNFDPPLLVLGWRTRSGLAWTEQATDTAGSIPTPLRFFLGGDASLRGFARQELPISGEGYLTIHYQGVEARAVDVLPYHLQPLAFVDAAMAGRHRFELQREIYWAPGFGMRWASPVGAMRFTLARSFTARRDPTIIEHKEHWQFFFSWGQEF